MMGMIFVLMVDSDRDECDGCCLKKLGESALCDGVGLFCDGNMQRRCLGLGGRRSPPEVFRPNRESRCLFFA